MPQLSILGGIYSDAVAEVRTSYPRNMVPVFKDNGVSIGYLRQAEGIDSFSSGPGVDRGAIVWNGVHYRVMGTKLVSVSGAGVVTVLGDVGAGPAVSLDYSFVNLIIGSGGRLYYWDGATLTQVTDPDLGTSVDSLFLNGYTVSTDGEFIVVTDLNNPLSVDPLKYGSSEVDPDPIVGLRQFRNELYALNRFTIEVFDNVGGAGFPFAPIAGAQITKGCVGTRAAVICAETLAFMGGGRNEAIAIYLGAGGQIRKISDDEIEKRISTYTEDELALCLLETRKLDDHEFLYLHLPAETWVYDVIGSAKFQKPIWFSLHSDAETVGNYRAKNFVFCFNQWFCGDKTTFNIGLLTTTVTTQYDEIVGWLFDTAYLYNASKGAIIHSLELVATPGRAPTGRNPQIFYSFTDDGLTWSNERIAGAGQRGEYRKRITWQQCGQMENYRGLRFRGANDTPIGFMRLEAELEPLYV